MVHVPLSVVGAVGRWFFRSVRRFPILFLLLCLVGLATGVGALFLFGQAPSSSSEALFLRLCGVGMIIFYGALAIMFIMKTLRGTWQQFCDWEYTIFENM